MGSAAVAAASTSFAPTPLHSVAPAPASTTLPMISDDRTAVRLPPVTRASIWKHSSDIGLEPDGGVRRPGRRDGRRGSVVTEKGAGAPYGWLSFIRVWSMPLAWHPTHDVPRDVMGICGLPSGA